MINPVMQVPTESGRLAEVYANKIDEAFAEYLQTLEDPNMIRKSTCFAGAMRHVYETVFQPHTPQPNNRNSIIDTADIVTLDKVWGEYTRLCYSAGIRPTLLRFALMTGIDMSTFDTWRTGTYRNTTSAHSQTVKRWLRECESSIYDAVLDNSVGAIFAAKACFGWRETNPIPVEYTMQHLQHETPEQIAARHMGATLPAKPDFDD